MPPEPTTRLRTHQLTARFHGRAVVQDVSLEFPVAAVTAIVGPSGCGKTTLLRTINRMHEIQLGASLEGTVYLNEIDIYSPEIDPMAIRKRVGMVFQHPTPFPTMSVFENVAAGLRLNGGLDDRDELTHRVHQAIRSAGLWDEVVDQLDESAVRLSAGQQQRLCIARAIAAAPEILLLDEPTASLDPRSSLRVEELIRRLERDFTIVLVTHNMQQAARVSEHTAFLFMGELVESGPTEEIFTSPREQRTEAYVTGRLG